MYVQKVTFWARNQSIKTTFPTPRMCLAGTGTWSSFSLDSRTPQSFQNNLFNSKPDFSNGRLLKILLCLDSVFKYDLPIPNVKQMQNCFYFISHLLWCWINPNVDNFKCFILTNVGVWTCHLQKVILYSFFGVTALWGAVHSICR